LAFGEVGKLSDQQKPSRLKCQFRIFGAKFFLITEAVVLFILKMEKAGLINILHNLQKAYYFICLAAQVDRFFFVEFMNLFMIFVHLCLATRTNSYGALLGK